MYVHCTTHFVSIMHCTNLVYTAQITLFSAQSHYKGLRVQIPAVSSVITEKVILAAGFIQSTLWHG